MSELNEGKENQSEYLYKVYDLAKGTLREVSITDVHKELGIDMQKAQELEIALSVEGLISLSAPGYMRITNKGIEEVEKVRGPRQKSFWERMFRKA
jgi:Mn-dependent DtxR family transcriptional regulator